MASRLPLFLGARFGIKLSNGNTRSRARVHAPSAAVGTLPIASPPSTWLCLWMPQQQSYIASQSEPVAA